MANKDTFDILIIGGGPIGASTAYFLSQSKKKKVLLLTQDPTDDHSSTYKFAGGSIQYGNWPQPIKLEMTQATAKFIKQLVKKGVDLSFIEDGYLFLDEGVVAPAININGSKLVKYLLEQSEKAGVKVKYKTTALKINKEGNNYRVETSSGEYLSKKVLVAIGPSVKKLIPNAPVELEKRQLFILDTKVDEKRAKLPHTIIPLSNGWVYFFIKKIDDQYKLIIGQEELFEHNEKWEEENYFSKLMSMGLEERAPFLKGSKVEKILWGFDSFQKTLEIFEADKNLYSVNCGSAVRSCAYIGQKIAKKLLDKD